MELQTSDFERIDQTRYYEHGFRDYSDPPVLETKGEILHRPDLLDPAQQEVGRGGMTTFNHHWFSLYNVLTYEEANTLYNYLKPQNFQKGQKLIGFTDSADRLFFLNKGSLAGYSKKNERVRCNKTFTSGTVIGASPFFAARKSENMIMAIEDVELDVLERADLERIESDSPDLVLKLKEFCIYQGKGSLFKIGVDKNNSRPNRNEKKIKKSVYPTNLNENTDNFAERRMYSRVKTSGAVVGKLFDLSDVTFEYPVRGTLNNISKGGFSFDIKPIHGVDLIGKKLDAVLNINVKRKECDIDWGGTIVGVKVGKETMSVNVAGRKIH